MSKWENILVGDDGLPYLLDYQIHFRPPPELPLRWLLHWGQQADLYYLHRHWRRCRPDQLRPDEQIVWSRPPLPVWVAEAIGPIFRRLRLLILRAHGVRGDPRKGPPGGLGAGRDRANPANSNRA
ncbi:hypothetical protein CCR95_14980 [Thiocystis minor]|nr:hypothetical protein [Thiocystis minor]